MFPQPAVSSSPTRPIVTRGGGRSAWSGQVAGLLVALVGCNSTDGSLAPGTPGRGGTAQSSSSGGSTYPESLGGGAGQGGASGPLASIGGEATVPASTGGVGDRAGGGVGIGGNAATALGGNASGGRVTGGSGTGGSGTGGSGTNSGGGLGGPTGGSGGKATGGRGAGGGGTAGTSVGSGSSTEFCSRWTADRADLSESGWTGSVASCTAGDMSATSRANALRLLNLYRWIAGLPAVATSDVYNQQDQACALMMDANNQVSHTPSSSWSCYSSAGASVAQNSCVAGEGIVSAIAGFMTDPGNETTLGHRRWMLSNSLGPIGIGSTGSYSCLYTGSTGNAGKAWIAWPAPGYFPILAASDNWNRTIDSTGWSIQSDTINLAGAAVAITLNGTNQPVTVTQLPGGYGSKYAINIKPGGWKIASGNAYHVAVTGIPTAISYDVQVVDCK